MHRCTLFRAVTVAFLVVSVHVQSGFDQDKDKVISGLKKIETTLTKYIADNYVDSSVFDDSSLSSKEKGKFGYTFDCNESVRFLLGIVQIQFSYAQNAQVSTDLHQIKMDIEEYLQHENAKKMRTVRQLRKTIDEMVTNL